MGGSSRWAVAPAAGWGSPPGYIVELERRSKVADDDDRDCVEHLWALRGVTFDLNVGAVEDYECVHCPAVTVKQAAT